MSNPVLALLVLVLFLFAEGQQEQRRRHRRYGKHGPSKRAPSMNEQDIANAAIVPDNCDTKFVKYQSSPYETKWLSEINTREMNCCLYLLREIPEQVTAQPAIIQRSLFSLDEQHLYLTILPYLYLYILYLCILSL
jgi:hypothetical protein